MTARKRRTTNASTKAIAPQGRSAPPPAARLGELIGAGHALRGNQSAPARQDDRISWRVVLPAFIAIVILGAALGLLARSVRDAVWLVSRVLLGASAVVLLIALGQMLRARRRATTPADLAVVSDDARSGATADMTLNTAAAMASATISPQPGVVSPVAVAATGHANYATSANGAATNGATAIGAAQSNGIVHAGPANPSTAAVAPPAAPPHAARAEVLDAIAPYAEVVGRPVYYDENLEAGNVAGDEHLANERVAAGSPSPPPPPPPPPPRTSVTPPPPPAAPVSEPAAVAPSPVVQSAVPVPAAAASAAAAPATAASAAAAPAAAAAAAAAPAAAASAAAAPAAAGSAVAAAQAAAAALAQPEATAAAQAIAPPRATAHAPAQPQVVAPRTAAPGAIPTVAAVAASPPAAAPVHAPASASPPPPPGPSVAAPAMAMAEAMVPSDDVPGWSRSSAIPATRANPAPERASAEMAARSAVGSVAPVIVYRYRKWVLGQMVPGAPFEAVTVDRSPDEWLLLSTCGVATLMAWTHEDHHFTYPVETWADEILPAHGVRIRDRELAVDLLLAAALHAGGIDSVPTDRLRRYEASDLVTAMASIHVGLLRLYCGLGRIGPERVLADQYGIGPGDIPLH